MPGRIEISKNKAGEYYFQLKNKSGKVISKSSTFSTLVDCKIGLSLYFRFQTPEGHIVQYDRNRKEWCLWEKTAYGLCSQPFEGNLEELTLLNRESK